MATVSLSPSRLNPRQGPNAETRIVLSNVEWDLYECLLHRLDGQPIRLTYDRGELELMAPSEAHEEFGKLLGRIVETVTEELQIPCVGMGSTTWRRQLKMRGLEADECYYLKNLHRVAGKRKAIELSTDPPPDLAIEIEISQSALDRLAVYAGLGVPEVWRFDGESLVIEVLQPTGVYKPSESSAGFPFLKASDLVHWVKEGEASVDHSAWNHQFRDWVRTELAPRLNPPNRPLP
jgi:Uma2 family endonuclease